MPIAHEVGQGQSLGAPTDNIEYVEGDQMYQDAPRVEGDADGVWEPIVLGEEVWDDQGVPNCMEAWN